MTETTFRDLRAGALLVLGDEDHAALVTPTGWLDIAAPLSALVHTIVRIEQEAGVARHV